MVLLVHINVKLTLPFIGAIIEATCKYVLRMKIKTEGFNSVTTVPKAKAKLCNKLYG